jgi:eukaryotic-like serine/threonine-protein kinase
MGADAAAEEQFGPYLVYERLGVGGMATVHRALERGIEGFERIVALKRLLPHLAADATFIKSFVREAKLASLLNHVNIVQIFELGRVGTQYFISMEHIDGRDVRRILRHARKASGPPPIHVTVGILLQLCDALDYAHHKADDIGHPLGLVHRDVSPSNVLVTTAGQVKVIDFGIAKAQSSQLRTQTGRVKGKIAYMAPEALAGKDLDARSDLFAVGVIAHELLTARPLFSTKNEYQTLMKVQRGEIVPPSTINPGCPAELDAIVLRALARDPDHRFVHASALRDDLNTMRKQYGLATSNRDIATWLEWAFSLEVPTGSLAIGNTLDHTPGSIDPVPSSPRHRPSSRPKRNEEDEVVDLAWGGAEEHHSSEPVVLDDVPDVTDKHLTSASLLGADVRLDLDDLVDDIPAPVPSHGIRPGAPASSRTVTTPLRPLRSKSLTPAPTRTSQVVPVQVPRERRAPTNPPVRNAQDDIATPKAGVGVRSGLMPPRVRTITIPPLAVPAGASSPRTFHSLSPPPPAVPATSVGGIPEAPMPLHGTSSASSPSRAVPATSPPPRGGARAATPPRGHRAPSPLSPPAGHTDTSATERTLAFTGREAAPHPDTLATERTPALGHEVAPRPDGPVTDRTPVFSPEDLDLPSDTMPAMPAMRSSEPIVRFRPPTNPPQEITPAAAGTAGRSSGPPPRLITPATELFAEPDPDADGDPSRSRTLAASASTVRRPSSSAVARTNVDITPATPATPAGRSTLRRVVLLAVVVVVAGAAATGGYLYVTRDQDTHPELPGPVPPSAKTSGTIKFVIVPPDATITITGKPPHAGSPWDAELAPGVHQVGIHRDGYKGRLTSVDLVAGETQVLRIVLDPDTSPDGAGRRAAPPLPDRVPLASGPDPAAPSPAPYQAPEAPRPANGSSAPPSPDQATPTPVPPPSPDQATPTPVPPPQPPPRVRPAIVSPKAVSKLSGDPPNITKVHGEDIPQAISARLCIDEAGQVVTSEVLTRPLPAHTAVDIANALRSWRYTPYQVNGAAHAACFIATIRTR